MEQCLFKDIIFKADVRGRAVVFNSGRIVRYITTFTIGRLCKVGQSSIQRELSGQTIFQLHIPFHEWTRRFHISCILTVLFCNQHSVLIVARYSA